MYKIITRLHTESPAVYRYHMITDENGNISEFQAETLDEVELEMTKILEKVGYYDLRVVTEEPYYIDLAYEEDPDFDGEKELASAYKMLGFVGYKDLKISDSKPYHISIVFGVQEEETEVKYRIDLTGPDSCIIDPYFLTDINEGSSKSTKITFPDKFKGFHLIIDGEETLNGLPEWIEYEPFGDREGVLTFKGIKSNHNIELVLDLE